MIDPPEITEMTPQLKAYIPMTVPRSHMRMVMGPGLSELRAVLKGQGIRATGPWFTHYLRIDGEVFDLEICLPVEKAVVGFGRVMGGTVEKVKVARTCYQGPYEGLGEAWAEFKGWIKAKGYRQAPDLFQCYLEGPETGFDPAEWRTELSQPLED